MATSKNSPEPDRFDRYVAVLCTELDAAARVRWDDATSFLWRARRVGEALLRALAASIQSEVNADPDTGLSKLLANDKIRTLLTREAHTELLGIQTWGNTAVHIQADAVKCDPGADAVAPQLADLVEWFFRERHPTHTIPVEVSQSLLAIRDANQRLPGIEESLRLARLRIAEVEAQVTAARTELLASQRRLQASATKADQTQATTRELRASLDAATAAHAQASTELGVLKRKPPQPPEGGRRLVGTLAALAFVALLAGTVLGAGLRRWRTVTTLGVPVPAELPVTTIPTDTPMPAPVSPFQDAGGTSGDAGAPVPPVVPPTHVDRTCPDGTVPVLASPFVLSPYPGSRRPHWPPPITGGRSRSHTVRGFCIERAHHAIQSDHQPVTAITHDHAMQACASWQGGGWTLASIIQWEAVARTPSAMALIRATVGPREWVLDDYPSAALGLPSVPGSGAYMYLNRSFPPQGNLPWFSWLQYSGDSPLPNMTFRCAMTLSSAGHGG